MKTHFTRKNFIALSLSFFYIVLVLICAVCIDRNSGIVASGNPIQSLAYGIFNVTPISRNDQNVLEGGVALGFAAWCLIIVFCIYFLLFVATIIYELRLAKYFENKFFSKKWIITYSVTFLVCTVLFLGIGLTAQYPYEMELILNSLFALAIAIVTALILFLMIGSLIFFLLMLIINIKNIDKPFKWFGRDQKSGEELEKEAEEEALQDEQGKLAEAFGEQNPNEQGQPGVAGVGAGVGGATGEGTLASEEDLSSLKKENVFPGLCKIDEANDYPEDSVFDNNLNLEEITVAFRNYLAKEEKLYFDLNTIRAFLAGLSASRLIILEGLSGTGKSSIARYFSEFIGESSFFIPVQATFRDRTNILGFFNDFSRTYNETEFLKRMYEYSYKERNMNIMVLDEMNISRVEYYFADFLSILEYPQDEWKLKIMQLPFEFEAPRHLEDGVLHIPANTWFIGTANKDDSTYTITDKVYDRAITITFDDRNPEFEVEEDSPRIRLSFDYLTNLYAEAQSSPELNLNSEDLEKFRLITDFTSDSFDLTFGNRIMNQIYMFVPVYVSAGGTKEDALDFMFAQKVLFKLEGHYEDYVKKGLEGLSDLIKKTYGEESFTHTMHLIRKLLRRF